jgi:hypothetical protein
MGDLRRTDKALLLAALASNGGGVDSDRFSEATRKRLLKSGLIQWKPNQHKSNHFALLLTLTPDGRQRATELKDTP